MATASITLTDDGDQVLVAADFGDAVVQDSQAHAMIGVLLQSILSNAKQYQAIEDTAPEIQAEPSLVITPDTATH